VRIIFYFFSYFDEQGHFQVQFTSKLSCSEIYTSSKLEIMEVGRREFGSWIIVDPSDGHHMAVAH
jgi:hypothetical protein